MAHQAHYGTGTGYISFADYMRGNQDTIQSANDQIGNDALSGLNTEVDKYHQLADTAAGHTDDAFRAQMNDQYGFNTADAYRATEDYRATRAAHPDLQWQGIPDTQQGLAKPDEFSGTVEEKKAYLADQAKPKDVPYLAGPSLDGKPLPGTGTNNDAANPYALSGFKGDEALASNWIGQQDYGQAANTQEMAAKNKANDTANLGNWGGVFDAYKQKNKGQAGYGNAGAGFDAILAGGGLSGVADKGKAIAGGLDQYGKDAIHAHAGDNDMAGYTGHDTYVSPPVAPNTAAPYTWNPLPSDAGGGWQDPGQQKGTLQGPSPTATDDSGGSRNGGPAQTSTQQNPSTPDDPWKAWGG